MTEPKIASKAETKPAVKTNTAVVKIDIEEFKKELNLNYFKTIKNYL
jgi:hypothetical protein